LVQWCFHRAGQHPGQPLAAKLIQLPAIAGKVKPSQLGAMMKAVCFA
jgi:hypothetical protein